jgi:hypothetical protein
MKGAAYWAATIIAVIVIGTCGWMALEWIAEKFIAAVDWMTRHER